MDYTSVQPPSPRWEEKGEKTPTEGIAGFTHRYGLHFGLLQWLAALGILRFQAQPLAFQRLVPALMLGPVSLHTREVQRGGRGGKGRLGPTHSCQDTHIGQILLASYTGSKGNAPAGSCCPPTVQARDATIRTADNFMITTLGCREASFLVLLRF